MSLLSLDRASLGWPGKTVLRAVSMTLHPGERVALLGENGSGKSTLLRSLAGELPLCGGSLRLLGRDLERWPPRERARQMACLPQGAGLAFPFSVAEVVSLGRLPHGRGTEAATLVDTCLAWTDTAHLAVRAYPTLSGGERQRVQLARVLCQLLREHPREDLSERLLLLDEPTNALDLRHKAALQERFMELSTAGCCVVFSTHDLEFAAAVSQRVVGLSDGAIAMDGSSRSMLTEERLARLFGTAFRVVPHPDRGYAVATLA